MVVLDKPIKTLGVHEVKVRLHAEVTVTVNAQHRPQRRTKPSARPRGENVITSQFEEDRVAAEEAAADLLEGGAGQLATEFDLGRSLNASVRSNYGNGAEQSAPFSLRPTLV